MPGPLDGVKVLEFTEIIAGPFSGMLLSDMGADVIKVEPPWGEPWRFAQPFMPNESKTFIGINRGKKSLTLDLTKPEAREIVYKMVPDMDVVIINSRPDVPNNLGIDYETLSKINPALIYCETTAFGRHGPHSDRPGYDIIAQAMTGLMAAEDKIANGVPQPVQSTPLADFSTGITIAWSVCAALYSREQTGKGQKVETTLLGTALALQAMRFTQVDMVDRERTGDFLESLALLREAGAPYKDVHQHYLDTFDPGRRRAENAYYRTYQAKDGVLAVGCLSDPLRKRMVDVLGLDDIRFQPGYDMYSEETQAFNLRLVGQAEEIFLKKTVSDWLELLDAAGVPAGPVRFVEELLADEQVVSNGLVVELEHTQAGKVTMVGPLVKMSETPLEAQSASPALGESTVDILRGLGYDDQKLNELRQKGVIR
ncbi:MAG: hypothetical protein BZY79_03690 [SAR202 cluster bacterium Casp-Chloro-G4]|nr:CoA transferase [Chloroflexota bacterium]MDA1227867.1 CoA transferase [Chloroflexota bacterium]PKB61475.1 MAG: hypothetical protein BZY79_03690 [SAR202 cluster bacterium Casp-Chloro-G4]